MQINKLYGFLLVALFLLNACGNDDEITGRALVYKESNLDSTSIKVYVGSPDGGKLDTLVVKPADAQKIFNKAFENYTKTNISFDEDRIIISQSGFSEISLCRIDKDTLWISNRSEYLYFGYYMKDRALAVVQNYVYAKKSDKTTAVNQIPPTRLVDKDMYVKYSLYGSFSAMTSEKDTLISCTRISVFR